MNGQWRISRRTVLRGIGAGLALPWLDVMEPAARGARLEAAQAPKRLACIFQPNGIYPPAWDVRGAGANFEFSPILEPLKGLREHISVLSNLSTNVKGHVQATSAFLTGTPLARAASGPAVLAPQVGVSLDQLVAKRIGRQTRLASIELGTEPPRSGGENDLPISFANTVSWRENGTKIDPEIHPQAAFDRLFAVSRKTREELLDQKSIIDRVLEDASKLQRRGSSADRRKLDEYLTAVRDVEKRVQENLNPRERGKLWTPPTQPELARPGDGLPARRDEHLRLMMDLLVLGFWTDTTRVGTLMLAHGFSRQNFTFLEGVSGDHHSISHHKNQEDLTRPYTIVSRWYISMLAYLIEKMQSVDDGGGRSLLDNSIVLYGSGLKDGNGHVTRNLPIVLAGHGGGDLHPGRHIVFSEDTPISNLHLTLARKMGVDAERFNNSTGELTAL